MYTLTANYKTNDGGKKLEPPHEGKCINPNLLKSLSYVEPTLSWGIYLSLWERVSKDSVWTILTADVTSNETNYRDESVEATDGGKARFRSVFSGIDIISYTYRF